MTGVFVRTQGARAPISYHLVLLILSRTVCGHMFFHEESAVLLRPGKLDPSSDFGLSLAYWQGSLIVGSPHSDFFGKLYTCPLKELNIKEIRCEEIELNATSTPYTLEINPHPNFYLGAAIATTKDYVFTCAPLVTKKLVNSKENITDAVGTCFIYNGTTATTNEGPGAIYLTGDTDHEKFTGGTGWTVLADEESGHILIVKTSEPGNVYYVTTGEPQELVKTIFNQVFLKKEHFNVGYGMAAGKFFSDKTVFAISLQTKLTMVGQIAFIETVPIENAKTGTTTISLDLLTKTSKKRGKRKEVEEEPFVLESGVVGGMFGYALGAADMNKDGRAELFVGAPLQSEDSDELEYGALHVYLGGSQASMGNKKNIRTIMGDKARGRFGMTIAASDIDGDKISEVFVSAPYEDTGVVYILSGHSLNSLLSDPSSSTARVSNLPHTQRILKTGFQQLGFSLQIVPDVDHNGCNEIAIGSPGSAAVLIYKCFQTVRVVVTSQLKGENVRIQDMSFAVEVCLQITRMTSPHISGSLEVTVEIEGHAIVEKPSFFVDLSKANENHCEIVTVKDLVEAEPAVYELTTKVKLVDTSSSSTDFDKSWVKLSIHSQTEHRLSVTRQCNVSDDCVPQASLEVRWKDHAESSTLYEVESSANETMTVSVKNTGSVTTAGHCVRVTVSGAPVASASDCVAKEGFYECRTKKIFKPKDHNDFDMVLDMSSISSLYKQFSITALLLESCDQPEKVDKNKTVVVNYSFDKPWKKIQVTGIKHERLITDIDLTSKYNEESQQKSVIKDDQEFMITNDGSVTWKRMSFIIEVEKQPHISNVSVMDRNCHKELNIQKPHLILCSLTLPSKTTTKLTISMEMTVKEIEDALNQKKNISIITFLTITNDESSDKIQKTLVTNLKLQQEISLKNRPVLIAVIAAVLALLLLLAVVVCLYKKGFFKRQKKKELNVLRESFRRRSIRRSTYRSHSNADEDDHIDIEVVDDSPFEEVPMEEVPTKSDVNLVEAEAQVHESKPELG